MSITQTNLLRAYVFWIATLMFGLPLLTSFYPVTYIQGSAEVLVLPYILATAIIGLVILTRQWRVSKRRDEDYERLNDRYFNQSTSSSNVDSYKLAYAALFFATLSVFAYYALRYFVNAAYPSPAGESASIAGLLYLATVSLTATFGVPFLLIRFFPALKRAFSSNKRFQKIAIIIGVAYFITYLILVNQIVITGFNTPPSNYIPSPTGTYPFVFPFTSGPSPNSALESAFYVPQITIQISPYLNLLFMPFEMILAVTLSSLVSASIIITYFLIQKSKYSCFTGATVSAVGGFFGFTATCPMCLAPTLVSILLGGVSAAVPSFYSHITGVVIPPLVSVGALLAGIAYLNFQALKGAGPSDSVIAARSGGAE